jgi:CheY-like chemotaxis protein
MAADPGALLWSLRGHGRDVRCMRQRTSAGLELRVLWGDELFLTETFHDPDRLQKRAEEFKATLEARGWRPMTRDEHPASPPVVQRAPEAPAPSPAAPSPAASPSRRQHGATHQPRVLIVDDEPAIRTFLRRYLQEAGYVVSEAADVDGALNALDQAAVDAVVLDVRLPDPMGWGRTGLEVLAFIRLHHAFSRLPVLILTGHSLEPEEQELINRHQAHLFMKPDGYRMLLQRLDQLTGGEIIGQ